MIYTPNWPSVGVSQIHDDIFLDLKKKTIIPGNALGMSSTWTALLISIRKDCRRRISMDMAFSSKRLIRLAHASMI